MPTETDLEFGDIALQNKLLSKKQYEESIETLEKLEAKYKGKKGKKPRLVDVLVQLGYLSGQQAASVEKARNYRALRREDKLYARVAIKSKFATKKQIADGLEAQKQSYLKGKGKEPTRLPEWLNEKEVIDVEQDKAIREVLDKLDVSEYLATGKKKAVKKPAKSDSDSGSDDDDAEELDEDDIEEVDDLELADEDDDKKKKKPAKKGSDSDDGSDDDSDEDSEPKKKPAAKKVDSDDVIDLDGEDEVEEVDSNIENKLDLIDDEVAAEVKGSGIAKKGGAAKKPEPKKTSKSAQTDEDLPELELADDDDLKEPKKASAKAPAAKGGKKGGDDDISDLEDVDLDDIEEAEAKADEDGDEDDIDIEEIDEIDLDDDEDESPKKKASGGKKK